MSAQEGMTQERHGFAGADVQDGYGGDDRGVVPSLGSPWVAQKQPGFFKSPPAHPKRGGDSRNKMRR